MKTWVHYNVESNIWFLNRKLMKSQTMNLFASNMPPRPPADWLTALMFPSLNSTDSDESEHWFISYILFSACFFWFLFKYQWVHLVYVHLTRRRDIKEHDPHFKESCWFKRRTLIKNEGVETCSAPTTDLPRPSVCEPPSLCRLTLDPQSDPRWAGWVLVSVMSPNRQPWPSNAGDREARDAFTPSAHMHD